MALRISSLSTIHPSTAFRQAIADLPTQARYRPAGQRQDSAARDEAARHYDEPALAALILSIATTSVYNHLNVTTRQVAGAWG